MITFQRDIGRISICGQYHLGSSFPIYMSLGDPELLQGLSSHRFLIARPGWQILHLHNLLDARQFDFFFSLSTLTS